MPIPLDKCSGCGLCSIVCPNNCISMKSDFEGFRYPSVDKHNCVGCLLCQHICPILADAPNSESIQTLGAQNKKDYVRQNSSSGGVFSALAEITINAGGAICAAQYDKEYRVVHSISNDMDYISMFRGAKYSQSSAEHCFSKINDLLNQEKPVLFVGTPCQCAALKAYLNDEHKNLLTVDTICHGVPSPMVWQRYLDERSLIDANGSSISSINLRSKTKGWSRYSSCVEISYNKGNLYSIPQGQDPFMQGFVQNLYLRPSCANCSFKGIHRSSDITLGDFWGIWDINPEFDDNKGTSLVIIHSNKGQAAWNKICGDFDIYTTNIHDAIAQNPSAIVSSVPHPKRLEFFEMIKKQSVIDSIQACLHTHDPQVSLLRKLWNRICGQKLGNFYIK